MVTWNKTKITMVNNALSHRNLIIVKGTHCKDPPSRTDLSKLLYSLPILWSQWDKNPRSLLTVVVEVTGPVCNIRTFVGNQLSCTSHRINTSDRCHRVPSELTNLKNEKSKDCCKADLKQRALFFITIFRLAIPAFFRFSSVEHQNSAKSPKTLQNRLRRGQTTKNTTRQKGTSILFKYITFFLSFKKNRLHPIQDFVNNRL